MPDRSISAFDLVDASSAHLMMVIPDATLPVPPSGPFPEQELALPQLQGDHIYVVNGLHVTVTQLSVLLQNIDAQLAGERLKSAPSAGSSEEAPREPESQPEWLRPP